MTKEDLLLTPKEEWLETFEEGAILDFIMENNEDEFLLLKLAEECAELGKELIQLITKPDMEKPLLENVRKEVIDVMFRIMTVAQPLKLDDFSMELSERLEFKMVESLEAILKKG